jgi:ABC-type polysaccharide/polyol phosphate transport system ATPase subunit
MMDFILKDTTATTIFTSSEISIAMSCDQIIHIEKGVVINQGSAQIVAASLIK